MDEFAECEMCGWQGPADQLQDDPTDPIGECCPKCGSSRTWRIDEPDLEPEPSP